jgi:2-amino-4-hydroxy-6-hydroxymethyldihydropteridine diphosphokinase
MRAGISLGSNLGDRFANLSAAAHAISYLGKGHSLTSGIYETDPIGCEREAPKFLNAVLEIEYEGDAVGLLQKLGQIEVAMGRPADHERNISRNIDIDLLYFGDLRVATEQLQLPHPRMHLRRFVLQPLADIRPDLILPNQDKTVRELLAELSDSSRVVRFKANVS